MIQLGACISHHQTINSKIDKVHYESKPSFEKYNQIIQIDTQ